MEASQITAGAGAGAVASTADRGYAGADAAGFGRELQARLEGEAGHREKVAGEVGAIDGGVHGPVKGSATGARRIVERKGEKTVEGVADGAENGVAQSVVVPNLGLTAQMPQAEDTEVTQAETAHAQAAPGADSLSSVGRKGLARASASPTPAAAEMPAAMEVDATSGPAARMPALLLVESVSLMKPLKTGEQAASVGQVVLQDGGAALHKTVSGEKPQTAAARGSADFVPHADEARILEASTGVLEVGVANGTHGWLRVRAELGEGGGVDAQVVATSAVAAEGLHKELPALTAYLAHEQVGLSSLVVHALGAGAEAQEATTGTATGFAEGQGSASGRRSERDQESSTGQGVGALTTLPAGEEMGGLPLPLGLHGSGINGGWLSVRV